MTPLEAMNAHRRECKRCRAAVGSGGFCKAGRALWHAYGEKNADEMRRNLLPGMTPDQTKKRK